ncbi:MAG: STAS domain-containing protein [Candidatus Acidiferrales bacterium]
MNLQIAKRQSGDVMIIDLAGRVTIGRENDLLCQELHDTIASGAHKLLINLENVKQMDSSGISCVVRNFVSLQRVKGSLKLLRPRGHVRDVLELTHLLQSIPSYEDEAAALASFS